MRPHNALGGQGERPELVLLSRLTQVPWARLLGSNRPALTSAMILNFLVWNCEPNKPPFFIEDLVPGILLEQLKMTKILLIGSTVSHHERD